MNQVEDVKRKVCWWKVKFCVNQLGTNKNILIWKWFYCELLYIGVSQHRIPNNARFKLYYPSSKQNVQKSNSKSPQAYFTNIESVHISKRKYIPMPLLNAINNLENAKIPLPCYQNAPINNDNKHKYPYKLFKTN